MGFPETPETPPPPYALDEANLVSNIANNFKSFLCYVNSSLKARPIIDVIQHPNGSLAPSDQE